MQNEKVPEWALERAVDLYHREPIFSSDIAVIYKHALARYIAEHEEPPVDPLVIEAREAFKEYGPTRYTGTDCLMPGNAPARVETILRGEGDDYWEMRVVLAALRRGIELARQEDSHAG